jgi:predicted nucleic acid-binding protein
VAELRAYFDTSVLVKPYVNEEGSFQARLLSRKYRCVSSDITSVEMTSALIGRLRASQLSACALAAIAGRLPSDRRKWLLINVNDSVLTRAEQVVRDCGIKSLDAIHIASALQFQVNSGMLVPFLSADRKQLLAAAECGLRVEPLIR